MRKSVNKLGCIITGVAVALSAAPVGHADNDSFAAQAESIGFQQNSDALIRMGWSACYFLRHNRGADEVTERIKRYGNVTSDEAQRFFALAVHEYCPEFS